MTGIVGLRGWNVLDLHGEPTLVSPARPAIWRPGEVQEAMCWLARHWDSPAEDCTCGIWAARPGGRARLMGDVLGLVSLGGRVVEHRAGWRGQYAVPIALALRPCASCGAEADRLGFEHWRLVPMCQGCASRSWPLARPAEDLAHRYQVPIFTSLRAMLALARGLGLLSPFRSGEA